jgi:hypothetical protein
MDRQSRIRPSGPAIQGGHGNRHCSCQQQPVLFEQGPFEFPEQKAGLTVKVERRRGWHAFDETSGEPLADNVPAAKPFAFAEQRQ